MDYFNGLGEIIFFWGVCQPDYVKLISFPLKIFVPWPERQVAVNPE
jgi:hypothetical protein